MTLATTQRQSNSTTNHLIPGCRRTSSSSDGTRKSADILQSARTEALPPTFAVLNAPGVGNLLEQIVWQRENASDLHLPFSPQRLLCAAAIFLRVATPKGRRFVGLSAIFNASLRRLRRLAWTLQRLDCTIQFVPLCDEEGNGYRVWTYRRDGNSLWESGHISHVIHGVRALWLLMARYRFCGAATRPYDVEFHPPQQREAGGRKAKATRRKSVIAKHPIDTLRSQVYNLSD